MLPRCAALRQEICLTHWDRVTHISVIKLTTIGSYIKILFENVVCEMAAMSSRPQCVKDLCMTHLIHHEAEIIKGSSKTGCAEPCIVEYLRLILRVMCMATPWWRHNDSVATKSSQILMENVGIFFISQFWKLCLYNFQLNYLHFKYELWSVM